MLLKVASTKWLLPRLFVIPVDRLGAIWPFSRSQLFKSKIVVCAYLSAHHCSDDKLSLTIEIGDSPFSYYQIGL